MKLKPVPQPERSVYVANRAPTVHSHLPPRCAADFNSVRRSTSSQQAMAGGAGRRGNPTVRLGARPSFPRPMQRSCTETERQPALTAHRSIPALPNAVNRMPRVPRTLRGTLRSPCGRTASPQATATRSAERRSVAGRQRNANMADTANVRAFKTNTQ